MPVGQRPIYVLTSQVFGQKAAGRHQSGTLPMNFHLGIDIPATFNILVKDATGTQRPFPKGNTSGSTATQGRRKGQTPNGFFTNESARSAGARQKPCGRQEWDIQKVLCCSWRATITKLPPNPAITWRRRFPQIRSAAPKRSSALLEWLRRRSAPFVAVQNFPVSVIFSARGSRACDESPSP